MTAFPEKGNLCSSLLKRTKAKTEKPKVTPFKSTKPPPKRKIFKIKKISKFKNKGGDDDEPTDYEKAFNIAPGTALVKADADADSQDYYKEIELGQSSGSGSPKKNKRQLVINLYGMDRNEDGSLRLVVGEKDSGVFKTPAGDAILKALKNKGQMFKGHMKVIYNYPDNVPTPDDDDGDDDLDDEDADKSDESSETPRKHVTRSSKKGPSAAKKRRKDESTDLITVEPLSPDKSANKAVVEASSEDSTPTKSGKPNVFKMAEERIATTEAIEILNAVLSGHHLEKIAREQIPKPRGGEIYLIDLEGLPKTRERKIDTYKWNNCGSKRFPKNKEVVMKTFYKVRLPNGYFSDVFVKHFYQMIESPRYCLVHYIGDPPVI